MDCYELLGCNENSTHEELKRAYHERLLQFHPDKNNTNVQKFFDIKAAWQVLGNPQTRKRYDAVCDQERLEQEANLVYAQISSSDLEKSDFENTFFYRCRCGERYLVEPKTLEAKNTRLHVMCDGCTLVIIVET
ncbi:hypothetical protein P5V15_013303 [Pogonomyrmex californicus]